MFIHTFKEIIRKIHSLNEDYYLVKQIYLQVPGVIMKHVVRFKKKNISLI